MTIKRIEVFRDRESAQERAEWMAARGYDVQGPDVFGKVIWDARDVTGTAEIASDVDDEVWVVVGTLK